MRLAIALLLMLIISGSAKARRMRDRHSLPSVEDVADRLIRRPPLLTPDRLPRGYKLGRCRLDVRGRTYIDGRCAFYIGKHGDFEFHGPHQVYSGVDYRRPEIFAAEISTDYFVQIDHELLDNGTTGPGWDAFWNEDKRATHAQSHLGKVTRHGACYVNPQVRICLWKR